MFASMMLNVDQGIAGRLLRFTRSLPAMTEGEKEGEGVLRY
jgi:hypothetical protein